MSIPPRKKNDAESQSDETNTFEQCSPQYLGTQYAERLNPNAFYEEVFDWIAAHEQLHGKKALDIGCGIGQHAIRLAKKILRHVAADFSEDRAAAAAENIGRQG